MADSYSNSRGIALCIRCHYRAWTLLLFHHHTLVQPAATIIPNSTGPTTRSPHHAPLPRCSIKVNKLNTASSSIWVLYRFLLAALLADQPRTFFLIVTHSNLNS
ncbi:hypothetical protein PtA15_9A281 [Puccinia triticina]|uniref:Uncharacterized protein n=1 Tax=Puccinia triticina TaxID=208348 RepID=A0ABY7CSD5_9BASI|nr:uncharacterized protein PtA15_9A281 [Puccinia triticina]WAQ88156.1 hypothetical protein PtA15_9A281 [Puccinia triticina]WAR60345.1 hypothetical protein PtB15_9B284 [Puccinia triticina]